MGVEWEFVWTLPFSILVGDALGGDCFSQVRGCTRGDSLTMREIHFAISVVSRFHRGKSILHDRNWF